MWSTIATLAVTFALGAGGLYATLRKNAADLQNLREEHARERDAARQRELEREAAANTEQRVLFDKRIMDYIDGLERRLSEVVNRNRELEQRATTEAHDLEAARLDAHQLRDRIRTLETPPP